MRTRRLWALFTVALILSLACQPAEPERWESAWEVPPAGRRAPG